MSDKTKKIGILVVVVLVGGYLAYLAFGPEDAPTLGDLIGVASPTTEVSPSATPGGRATPRPTPKTTPLASSPVAPQGLAGEVLAAMNGERASTGAGLLATNAALQAAAQAHAADMIARGYFAHDAPDGTTFAQRIAASGYPSSVVAENLGLTSSNRVADVVDGWMRSAGHRENMLDPKYKAVGVAAVAGKYQGQPATYVVAVFGDVK